MAEDNIEVLYRELTNAQKAALLLIALGQKWASQILRHMKEEEVRKVSFWIKQMRYVPQELTERIIRDFYQKLSRKTSLASSGGKDYLLDVLVDLMGETKARNMVEDLSEQEEHELFRILKKVNPSQLAAYLKQERPQTIALMMSQIDAGLAASIMGALPQETITEVLVCLAGMEETDPEMAMTLERALTKSLGPLATGQEMKPAGGAKLVAEILNNLSGDVSKESMDQLTEKDFDLATAIKDLMFVFDDVVLLDDKSMQMVLKEVEQADLILAMKGAGEDVQAMVYNNISKNQAETLKDELTFLGPVKASTVNESRQKIVNIIRKLDEEGKVLIQSKGGGGDDIIA